MMIVSEITEKDRVKETYSALDGENSTYAILRSYLCSSGTVVTKCGCIQSTFLMNLVYSAFEIFNSYHAFTNIYT